MVEAALPVCVYLLQFATKHTKNEIKTNVLKYLFMFLAP